MYLQHFSISGFRGVASRLELPLAQRTIVYGPNGSGKSSLLQAIAWTLYGKLPVFSGGAFTREDALVNDFLSEGKAEVSLTLSDNTTVGRQRSKQDSTTRGTKPPVLSFRAEEPQEAVEKLLGLNYEEFFAAVFLHQETIRDFLTTTPDKRSATIDRMIGTYLLRTLIKLVDPRVPDKVIGEMRQTIERVDQQVSQASVLNREMIQVKKHQYGDPETLPQVLAAAQQKLLSILEELGLPIPVATQEALNASLSSARQAQLERVGTLTKQLGLLNTLSQRHEQAAESNWQPLRQRRVQSGDPAELPDLVETIYGRLVPISRSLGIILPGRSIPDLESGLTTARGKQPILISQSEQKIAGLNVLKEHYQQETVTSWQGLAERKMQWGDPGELPSQLAEIRRTLTPILSDLRLPPLQSSLPALKTSLAEARRVLPGTVGQLERHAAEMSSLKERYALASQEIMENLVVPAELSVHRAELQSRIQTLSRDATSLRQQLNELQANEQEAQTLRTQVDILPGLLEKAGHLQSELSRLETTGKQAKLYSQVLDVSRQYMAQTRPDHCPICKQAIGDLGQLLDALRSETPADVEEMRQRYNVVKQKLSHIQAQTADLEAKQTRLVALDTARAKFPTNLDQQIADQQRRNEDATTELTKLQSEISRIEGQIRLMTDNRKRLDGVAKEIETALGREAGPNPLDALDQAIKSTHQQATHLSGFDFQPIADALARAEELTAIAEAEASLRQQVQQVTSEVRRSLGQVAAENLPNSLDDAIDALRTQVNVTQSLDLQPVANDLSRARQLQQIQDEENRLRRELEIVEAEIRSVLRLPTEEEDLRAALSQAVKDTQEWINRVGALDLQPVEAELRCAAHLDQIQKDEAQLRQLEGNNQVANRQKTRLSYRIGRLVELREALLDISETVKRRQESIVTGVLGGLDIHRYYQQLDPHPAYTRLQIEPELTDKGTYNYWVKALTDDYSHGTHVQTRFSTAQANCAAIAIFLAVNQHLSKNLETIILDDPSQSMDPSHKQRLAQTLAASPRQVIVATEDPQMFEFLKASFDHPSIYELQPWTTEGSRVVQRISE